MKRIFYLIIIITLPVIAFIQFDRYRRFHPPSAYQYEVSDKIDSQYHDPSVVLSYYTTAELCGTYARSIWFNYKVDVTRISPTDPNMGDKVKQYAAYKSKTQYLERKLIQSAVWKVQGYTNTDIKRFEEEGTDHIGWKVMNLLGESTALTYDDHGYAVYELQRLLNLQGFELPVDGLFAQETEQAVKDFQLRQNLYPTGIADDLMLMRLIMLQDSLIEITPVSIDTSLTIPTSE